LNRSERILRSISNQHSAPPAPSNALNFREVHRLGRFTFCRVQAGGLGSVFGLLALLSHSSCHSSTPTPLSYSSAPSFSTLHWNCCSWSRIGWRWGRRSSAASNSDPSAFANFWIADLCLCFALYQQHLTFLSTFEVFFLFLLGCLRF
jgi:hypothetical protein